MLNPQASDTLSAPPTASLAMEARPKSGFWKTQWEARRHIAETRPFRLACAALILALHLLAFAHFGRENGHPFNHAPGQSPYFTDPMNEGPPWFWDRFIVARWDSVHYMAMALDGYAYCPPRPVPANYLEIRVPCQLSFFPGYPGIAWVLSLGGRLALDTTMLAISLVASFVFLYLWTHEVMRRALGTRGCYMSLLAFNVFPSAFALVTIQTEPLVLMAAMGCFIAVMSRRLTLGALLCGFGTGIRITGVGIPVAYGLSLLSIIWTEKRKITPGLVLATLGRLALSTWGISWMAGYHWWRFNDPLAYVHSHARAFQHEPSVARVFFPDWELVHRSLSATEHEGMWVGLAMLWLALGLRKGLAGFTAPGKAFWIGLTISTLGIAMPGSVELAYAGMIRYFLLVFPLFFSIAAVGRQAIAAFVLWIIVSGWNYYNVTMRFYVTGSPFRMQWSNQMHFPPRPAVPPEPPKQPTPP